MLPCAQRLHGSHTSNPLHATSSHLTPPHHPTCPPTPTPTLRPLNHTSARRLQVYIMRHKLAPRWSTCVCVVGAGHLKGIK